MIPVEASTIAPGVDHLLWLLIGVSVLIMLLVGGLVLGFAIKYRRGSKAKRGAIPTRWSREIEIGWTAATLFTALFLFWFAAAATTNNLPVPKKAFEIHVVAKQWMWKIEHPGGQREIDALHVPVGVPVRLIMTSQDVIHSFFVPAFRLKADVLPGRYIETWFQPTKIGTFHLFCAEYCGTDHARMGGGVVVMTPADYARWSAVTSRHDPLATQGARAFVRLGCTGCHGAGARVPGPWLDGIYGRMQPITGGGAKIVDEGYLRDAILDPARDVTAGSPNVMPSYRGVASEEDVIRLIAYLKATKRDAAK